MSSPAPRPALERPRRFSFRILQRFLKEGPRTAKTRALVLTPTRELAEQVCTVLQALGKSRNIRVALIVGGEPLGPQVKALQAGAQVVVGTPGRVLDLYGQRFLSFPWTEFVVLDEADRMLEIGFIDDVKKILSYAPEERQTLLFSATVPPPIMRLTQRYMKDPLRASISRRRNSRSIRSSSIISLSIPIASSNCCCPRLLVHRKAQAITSSSCRTKTRQKDGGKDLWIEKSACSSLNSWRPESKPSATA